MTKPRVKVLYDDFGVIREVRVILGESTPKTRTFDEYNGIVTTRVDESRNSISSVSIDCQKLAGREYERMLVELMACMKDWRSKDQIRSRSIRQAIEKCLHAIGDERLEKVKNRLMAERHFEFGNLDRLVESCAKSRGDDTKAHTQALAKWIGQYTSNHKYMDELFGVCYEDHSGDWHYTSIVSGVLELISADRFNAYAKHRLDQGRFNNQHWRTFIGALTEGSLPKPKQVKRLQSLYELMAKVHPEGEKDQKEFRKARRNVLEHIGMLAGQLEKKVWEGMHEWFIKQMKDEPNEDMKDSLKNHAEDVAMWMKTEAEGEAEAEAEGEAEGEAEDILDAPYGVEMADDVGLGEFLSDQMKKGMLEDMDSAMDMADIIKE